MPNRYTSYVDNQTTRQLSQMIALPEDRSTGFTLIELLVAVSIAAILAAVAVPSYSDFINKGRITTAQSDLVALSLNFENQYQRVLAYPSTNYTDTSEMKAAFGKWSPASEESVLSFSNANASASAYTLIATGIGSGGIAGCVITLTSTGVKTITACQKFSSGEWL